MSQSTLVLHLPPREQKALEERLGREDFEFRPVPHAIFSAKKPGLTATLYKSGKLVVQGADPELFRASYLPDAEGTRTGERTSSAKAEVPEVPAGGLIGSDECGKGDYFGPLIVCAVRMTAAQAAALEGGGILDSKKLRDARALQLGAALRRELDHAVRRLDPVEYNRAHTEQGNLNDLLAALHAEAIAELAQPGMQVLVDQFSAKDLIGPKLAHLDLLIEQRPRAEENICVAAASIIARQEFLLSLRELSNEAGLDLPKGAGDTVDAAGVEYARVFGPGQLGQVAKLHFKNTRKVEQGLEEAQ